MADVTFHKATVYDLLELAEGLRWLDQQELIASAGHDIWATLERSLVASDDPVVVRAPEHQLIAVFGVAPISMLSDTASPWLLGTDLMTTHAKRILFHARRYIDFVSERYSYLFNYVDARNEPSIRWLKSVGFTVEDQPVPYGVSGLPFHRFHKGFDNV